MKIAVIVSTFPPYKGGMGNSAFEIAKILDMENKVTVFTTKPHPGPLLSKERELSHEFKVEYLKPTWKIGNGAVLLRLWKKLKDFDVLYLHYPFYGTAEIVWLYKVLHPSKKLIIHFHMDTPNLKWWGKILSLPSSAIKKSLLKKADKIITASLDYVAHSSIKNIWKKYPDKFKEILFGVHLEKFHVYPHDVPDLQNLRTKYGIQEKDKVVMFLGGLDEAHRFKGIDILLKACVNLKTKLLICGDGNKRKDYEDLAKELKIEKQVIFTGRIAEEEMTLHYNLADIFVLPSTDKSEAFGIVLLEAMACGVPVMASNLPGVRSVFENGVQGYTVAPNSVRHLRSKLEEYLRYPNMRYKMGREARLLVEEKYSWEKISSSYKEQFTSDK